MVVRVPRRVRRDDLSRRCSGVGGDLLTQLEDGQSDGDDEREETQLQCVPGFQSEHTDCQWDEGHSLQQDEHDNWNEQLLELVLTSCKWN